MKSYRIDIDREIMKKREKEKASKLKRKKKPQSSADTLHRGRKSKNFILVEGNLNSDALQLLCNCKK